jgi:hypothetical protein
LRVQRDEGLLRSLDAFHQHQRAALVKQRHHLFQHAARLGLERRTQHEAAVELDDLGLQPPHAVEVRMPGAEVVERDQAAGGTRRARGLVEVGVAGNGRLEDLDHHLAALQPRTRLQRTLELVVRQTRRRDEHLRLHVEEQPVRCRRHLGEVQCVDQARRTIALQQIGERAVATQRDGRLDRQCAGRILGAQQGLVANCPAVHQAVDWLEATAHQQAADCQRPAPAVASQPGTEALEAGPFVDEGCVHQALASSAHQRLVEEHAATPGGSSPVNRAAQERFSFIGKSAVRTDDRLHRRLRRCTRGPARAGAMLLPARWPEARALKASPARARVGCRSGHRRSPGSRGPASEPRRRLPPRG